MADKNSGWACTHSATITSQDNSGAYIEVICYWQNQGWRYDMNGVSAWVYCGGQEYCVKSSSAIDTTGNNQAAYEMGRHTFYVAKTTASQSISCYAKITSTSSYVSGTKSSSTSSISVAAKPSYTISYNANGGSGAPGNQTKWYNESLTLSSTKPTRTGHTFNGWATSASGAVAYQPGGSYTANAGVTLYAKWTAHTYTVSYNANGGSGAPGSQTKTYGVNLTLSSTKPTRTNYNFKGWSTSASGSVVYAAGATYTNNSAVTLYAVWELAYVKPRITNLTANRCNADGTLNDAGTCIKVTFNWATDKNQTCINVDWKAQSASSWTVVSAGASGTTSGSVTKILSSASTETSYYVRVYVEDGGGYTLSGQVSVGTTKYIIDIKSGGTGVAIGKVAETANLFDVGWKTRIRGDLTVDGNSYANVKLVAYVGSDTANTAGWYKVASQTMSNYGNTNILYYIKAGYNSGYYGLLDIEMRSNNTSISCWKCEWMLRSGFNTNHVRLVISGMTWTLYVYNPSYQYGRICFSEIQHTGIAQYKGYSITYYNSTTPESTEPTASVSTTNNGVWARKLEAKGGRITNANISHSYEDGYAHAQLAIATSAMTSNKPLSDGYILHFSWDNSGQYNAQFFIGNSTGLSGGKVQVRGCNSGTWGAWETLYRAKSLYENNSGTTGTVTLSESAENFSMLEIFFKSRYEEYTSTKLMYPNGKTALLSTWHVFASSSGTVVGMSRHVNISGTTLSTGTSDQYGEWWSYQNQVKSENNIYILKVIGYR